MRRTRKSKSAAKGGKAEEAQPSADDLAAIEAFKARQQGKPPIEEVSPKGLSLDGRDVAHAGNALASGDPFFVLGLCQQLQHIASAGAPFPTDRLNFLLSLIRAIEPRDPTEAILASQAAAIHCAFMESVRQLNLATKRDHRNEELNTMMRLSRVFGAQLDTLKRYRSKGEQSIQVQHQHVHVNAGKAVVGIKQGDGGKTDDDKQPHEQHDGSPRSTALLSDLQADRITLPVAGSEGLERVPVSRGSIRSARR